MEEHFRTGRGLVGVCAAWLRCRGDHQLVYAFGEAALPWGRVLMADFDFICSVWNVVLWTNLAKAYVQILLPWIADKYGCCDFH